MFLVKPSILGVSDMSKGVVSIVTCLSVAIYSTVMYLITLNNIDTLPSNLANVEMTFTDSNHPRQ